MGVHRKNLGGENFSWELLGKAQGFGSGSFGDPSRRKQGGLETEPTAIEDFTSIIKITYF